MIEFFEGIVVQTTDEELADAQITATDDPDAQNVKIPDWIKVQVADQPYSLAKVNLPAVAGNQSRPAAGSSVLCYRDSACTAKYVTTLSDPLPFESPVARNKFAAGEKAFAALGSKVAGLSLLPQPGAVMWLKNSGDAILASGKGQAAVVASDSANGTQITGNNISLQVPGNAVFTHGITLKSNILGGTEIYIGTKNPLTNIHLTGIHVKPLGGVAIGIEAAVPGVPVSTLVNGIGWDPILGATILASTFSATCAIKIGLTAPLISLTGALISFLGITSVGSTLLGIPSPFSVYGTTTLTGAVVIAGATAIVGETTIKGNTAVIGLLEIGGPLLLGFIGPQLPPVSSPGLLPSGYVPALINGQPVKIPFYV